jgi:hypothetical protein
LTLHREQLNKVLEIGIKIMRILREKRLNQELINGVSLTELRDKLYDEMSILQDNDRLLQAMGAYKDIKIVEEWIELENNN